MSKPSPIRWSISKAAAEFCLAHKTITARLAKSGALPGTDGHYSTDQIAKAIYGDYEKERNRKMKEEADRVAINNDEARRRLVDKSDLLMRFQATFAEMKTRILNSELPLEKKNGLLNSLAELAS